MRKIVLNIETTGLEVSEGNRIIEIGGVEINNTHLTGNNYHQYIQPDCEINPGAAQVHGLTQEYKVPFYFFRSQKAIKG